MTVTPGGHWTPAGPGLARDARYRALDYERTDAGGMKIAARAGYHDDLSMALLGAVSCVMPGPNPDRSVWGPDWPTVRTKLGVTFPAEPRPREYELAAFRWAEGAERANAAW